jgi:hypothetical protein
LLPFDIVIEHVNPAKRILHRPRKSLWLIFDKVQAISNFDVVCSSSMLPCHSSHFYFVIGYVTCAKLFFIIPEKH